MEPPDDSAWLLHDQGDNLCVLDIQSQQPEPPPAPADTTREPHTPPQQAIKPEATPKILFLDGLRGLAAMMVVTRHAGYIKEHDIGLPAVDIFFVLSAFLLTLIFEKKARTLRTQNASYRRWALALADYFSRRFLRVYPLFVLVACVLAALPAKEKKRYFNVNKPEEFSLFNVLTFEGHSRYFVFWSLPIEIQYYFLIPALVTLHRTLGKWRWALVTLGYAVVFYAGLYHTGDRADKQPFLPQMPTLLCGSLAAMVYSKLDRLVTKNAFVFTKPLIYTMLALELVLLLLLVSDILQGLVFDWGLPNPVPYNPKAGFRFVSFNVTVLIVCEMLRPGPLSSVLEWSLLRYAGQVSFSMYLLHVFVVFSPWIKHQTYYNKFVLLWTLVFLLSTVSFYAVERPCQQLAASVGKWIKSKDVVPGKAESRPPKPAKIS